MIDQQKIKEVFGEDACFAFWQHSRQTYRDLKLPNHTVDEIGIGVRHETGGTSGEFVIEFRDHGNHIAPKLCMFSGSWHLFPYLTEFIEMLTVSEGILIDDMVDKLLELGFVDKSYFGREKQ